MEVKHMAETDKYNVVGPVVNGRFEPQTGTVTEKDLGGPEHVDYLLRIGMIEPISKGGK